MSGNRTPSSAAVPTYTWVARGARGTYRFISDPRSARRADLSVRAEEVQLAPRQRQVAATPQVTLHRPVRKIAAGVLGKRNPDFSDNRAAYSGSSRIRVHSKMQLPSPGSQHFGRLPASSAQRPEGIGHCCLPPVLATIRRISSSGSTTSKPAPHQSSARQDQEVDATCWSNSMAGRPSSGTRLRWP